MRSGNRSRRRPRRWNEESDRWKIQATRDALTGLLNRRSLDIEIDRAVEQFQSVGTDACLLMIDIDHFKGLNDTLGHAAGDELLKSIAQIMRSAIRNSDQAFRCGGDEFVILLGGCGIRAGQRDGGAAGVFGCTVNPAAARQASPDAVHWRLLAG